MSKAASADAGSAGSRVMVGMVNLGSGLRSTSTCGAAFTALQHKSGLLQLAPHDIAPISRIIHSIEHNAFQVRRALIIREYLVWILEQDEYVFPAKESVK